MKIDILLPYKEKFSPSSASAVSLTIKNAMEYSKFFNNICVYGQNVTNPFYKKNFCGLNNNWILHRGHNRSLAYHYYRQYLTNDNEKKIIEIHNRPYIFSYLSKKINKQPITMHFHNDPQTMKGSKTIQEREEILNNASGIYFVSNFIKNKFTEGLKNNNKNLYVINNGIERKHKILPLKKKEILFVGRLVPEKGPDIFVKSIQTIAEKYKDWKFLIIGTSQAGQSSLKTRYEKNVIQEFLNCGSNVEYLGFLQNDLVQKKICDASILVIPSIWDEPFALVALEGLCHASAIISSANGGLPEVVQNCGIMIPNINARNLREKISELLSNRKIIEKYIGRAWNNYNFNISTITKKQDSIRSYIFNNFYK